MTVKKAFFIALGCLGLGIGAIGAVLPFLPTFPFLLLAAVCFAQSSERLHTWFIGTQLYKKNLESYMKGKGMTKKAKLRIMGVVSLTMLVGFLMMSRVPAARVVLAIVWLLHVLYFVFGIRTITEEEAAAVVAADEAARREEKKN